MVALPNGSVAEWQRCRMDCCRMVKLRNGYRCRMVALPIGSVAEWYRCRIASVAEWNVAEWIVAEWLSCRMVELPNGIVAEVCCGIYNNLLND